MQAKSLRQPLPPVSCSELQGFLWSTGTKRAGSYRFRRLRRRLDHQPRTGVFEFSRPRINWWAHSSFFESHTTKCGKAVKAADEILANVEAILRDEKIPEYTVVAAIRIHRSLSPEAKRKVLLLFPTA
jgi:hypothetical protein